MLSKGKKAKGQTKINQTGAETQLISARTVAFSVAPKDSVMALAVERKEKSEERVLLPIQSKLLSMLEDPYKLVPHISSEDNLDAMFDSYDKKDIEAIKAALPAQRQVIEQYSHDEFLRQGDPFFENRQKSLALIKEEFQKMTEQTCHALESVAKHWEETLEVELTQLLQDSNQPDQKALEKNHAALIVFQEKKFVEKIITIGKKLKILPSEANSFKKTVLNLLQKKSRSQPIGCELHTIEVSSEKELTLGFCQDNYAGFLPLLIRQKTEATEDKVWVYGHQKHLKLLLINKPGFKALKSQGESVLLDCLSQSAILVNKKKKVRLGKESSTMGGIFLVVKQANAIKEIKLTAKYYKHLLFSEKLTALLDDESLTPAMLEDIASCYGSGEILETREALTSLKPILYQSLPFSTGSEPTRLEQEDRFTPIYHDIVNKNGHVASVSEHLFEEIISELAKVAPSSNSLQQEHFLKLIEKFQKVVQRLKHYWQAEAPQFSLSPSFEDQQKLLALLKETESFSKVFPNIENKIKEPKENNEENFFILLKELQKFADIAALQIPNFLEAIEQEKKTVASDDFKRLYELSENSKALSEAKNFHLRLKTVAEKYPGFNKAAFLSSSHVTDLEKNAIFLEKLKNYYVELAQKIRATEDQLSNPDELLFSREEKSALEELFLSQVNFIKTALYTEMHFSGATFFAESLLTLEFIANSIDQLALVDEACLKNIVIVKQEWDALQAAESDSFLLFKNKFTDNSSEHQILSKAKTFREAIESLMEHLMEHKNSPDSKEFIEGKAQLEACLADWKTTGIYKKMSEISSVPEEMKTIQETALTPESPFELSLLAQQERLQKSSAQISDQISMCAKAAEFLDSCFIRLLQVHQSKMLSASLLKEKLSTLEQEIAKCKEDLIARLQIIYKRAEYTQIQEIDVQEHAMIKQLNLWQLAKEQYEAHNALLSTFENSSKPSAGFESKLKKEATAVQPLRYMSSISDLTKLGKLISFLNSLQLHYLLSAQKGLGIIENNHQLLENLGVKQSEILSVVNVSRDVDKIKHLVQTREEEVQPLVESIKLILTTQATILLDPREKIDMGLALDKLTRSTYAKLTDAFDKLNNLNRQIAVIVEQKKYYARQVETLSPGTDYANNYQCFIAAQKTLSLELDTLKQTKKGLLEGDVTQGIPVTSTLAILVFELKSELDKLVGKKILDEHYKNLFQMFELRPTVDSMVGQEMVDKPFMELPKVCFVFKPMPKKLVFKDDETKKLLESHLEGLKVALAQMRVRLEFVNAYLKEPPFSILANHSLTPKKYLGGLLKSMENLQITMKNFECEKMVDPAYFPEQASDWPTGLKPDPLAMAFRSHNHKETRKQFVAAHVAALQVRDFSEEAKEYFDAREEEILSAIENRGKAFHKLQKESIIQAKQDNQILRKAYSGTYTTLAELRRNNDLLLQYPSLLAQRVVADSNLQQHKRQVATQVAGAVIKSPSIGDH